MTERRRIAIVSQHLDAIGAEHANSVGICSRGLAGALAADFDVALYGRPSATGAQDLPGVTLRLIAEPRSDRFIQKAYRRSERVFRLLNRGYPLTSSTSCIAGPFLGRQVARDLAQWQPYLVLVQHNAWRVSQVKSELPNATVVLQLHQSIFPQELTPGYRRAALKADHVTAVSPFIAEAVEKQLNRPVSVIRNGVDPTLFDARATPEARGPNIAFCGAVSPEKGIHVLTKAFDGLLQTHPDATLTLIGRVGARNVVNTLPETRDPLLARIRPYFEGDYEQMLLSSLSPKAAERLRLTGSLDPAGVRAKVASADMLVLPSICDESFGLPVVEAMAIGVPAIVTESGAMPWLVEGGKRALSLPRMIPKRLNTPSLDCGRTRNTATRSRSRADTEQLRHSPGRALPRICSSCSLTL